MKICNTCGIEKEIIEFYKNKNFKDGLNSKCKECYKLSINQELAKESKKKYYTQNKDTLKRAYLQKRDIILANKREIYANNIESIKERRKIYDDKNRDKINRLAREKSKKYLYNLTEEEYRLLLVTQNEVCKICKQKEQIKDKNGNIKLLAVDHNHLTNKVRGLLCSKCNMALGLFKDTKEILKSAIEYLESYNEPIPQ